MGATVRSASNAIAQACRLWIDEWVTIHTGDCTMSADLWLAFAAASAIMLMIPGPTVLIVVSYALGHGRKSAMATVAGVALGDFTAMTASMLGLGVLLSTSAALFTLLNGRAPPISSISASSCGGRRSGTRRRWPTTRQGSRGCGPGA